MNEIIQVVLYIFIPTLLLLQINRLNKIRKLRKKYPGIPIGILNLETLLCCLQIGADLESAAFQEEQSERERKEQFEKNVVPIFREYDKRAGITADTEKISFKDVPQDDEELNKLLELTAGRMKTNLSYLSNILLVPKERIIALVEKTIFLSLEGEYVRNNIMRGGEELPADFEEKILSGICPFCDNAIDRSKNYCLNCGSTLVILEEK